MLKSIIFVLIAVGLSGMASVQFASALEVASASRPKSRNLELGKEWRVIFAAVFAVVMFVLAWMSKTPLLGTVVCLGIAIFLVLSNGYLKKNGIQAIFAFVCVWMGNLLASLKNANYTTASTGWSKVYIALQVICFVALLVGTVGGKILDFIKLVEGEEEEADSLEEDVDESEKELEDLSTPKVTDNSDDEEPEDEELDYVILEEETLKTAFQVFLIVAIVICFVVLGFWLENKFDFFPPYIR